MKNVILLAAGALALAACGVDDDGLDQRALGDRLRAAIDEKALAGAVSQSIDRKPVDEIARGTLAEAVQEAIPAEVRAVGAVVDEQALASGIGGAIDGEVLGQAVHGAFAGFKKPAER
jgi:hypothetical protein